MEQKLEFSVVYPTSESENTELSQILYNGHAVSPKQLDLIQDAGSFTTTDNEANKIDRKLMLQTCLVPRVTHVYEENLTSSFF